MLLKAFQDTPVAGTFDEVIELLKTTAKPWRMTFEEQLATGEAH